MSLPSRFMGHSASLMSRVIFVFKLDLVEYVVRIDVDAEPLAVVKYVAKDGPLESRKPSKDVGG